MTPESLIQTHQDGVYTVCLHVLGNSHDAEDAAQEALLKISSEASGVQEPRAFKSWLYRVTYRTAIDHLRKRATRRRIEEGSAPMTPSLTEEQREAIHEAMAALPDDDRLMLVEHYFEKVPLSELGRREGISDVAMGKRVEKAREKLKRGLAGAGILVAASQVAHALESVQAATAPKAALVAAGGTIVGSKTGLPILVALFLLLGVGGGVVWLFRGESPGQTESVRSTPSQVDSKEGSSSSSSIETAKSPAERPSILKCRSLIGELVTRLRSSEASHLAWRIHEVHAGGMPGIEEFVREFMKAAGDQLVPFSKSLLAESESDGVRVLLAIVLGRSGDPGSIEILGGLCGEDSSVPVRAVALYSAGLKSSPEGVALVRTAWEQVKKEGGPLVWTLMMAIGLQGAAGLEKLLGDLKDPRLDKILTYKGVPWSFSLSREDLLAHVRGADAFGALRRVFESDPDPKLRAGAAKGMMRNLDANQVEYLAQVFTAVENAPKRSFLVLALYGAPQSQARTELTDRILKVTPYPSEDLELDRSLVRLVQHASPQGKVAFLERFLTVASASKDEQLFWNVGAMYGAAASVPEVQARMEALMESAGFTSQQKGLVVAWGLYYATPETVAELSRPALELMRSSNPASDTFSNCLRPLLQAGLDERLISTALQDISDRQTDSEDRIRILWELISATGGSGFKTKEIAIPVTFLASAADRATDPITFLCAIHALAPSGTDALTRWKDRLGEWIGRDMKWVNHSESAFNSVAPWVIGDYYARFGTPEDATWLKDLPGEFPYPASWDEGERTRFKMALKAESSRAIDAIRLRN